MEVEDLEIEGTKPGKKHLGQNYDLTYGSCFTSS